MDDEADVTCDHEDIVLIFERSDGTTMGLCANCYGMLERIIMRNLIQDAVKNLISEMGLVDETASDDE